MLLHAFFTLHMCHDDLHVLHSVQVYSLGWSRAEPTGYPKQCRQFHAFFHSHCMCQELLHSVQVYWVVLHGTNGGQEHGPTSCCNKQCRQVHAFITYTACAVTYCTTSRSRSTRQRSMALMVVRSTNPQVVVTNSIGSFMLFSTHTACAMTSKCHC